MWRRLGLFSRVTNSRVTTPSQLQRPAVPLLQQPPHAQSPPHSLTLVMPSTRF